MSSFPINPEQPQGNPFTLASYASQSLLTPQVEVKATPKTVNLFPGDKDSDFLQKAYDRFDRVQEWEMDWRIKAREELNFCDGLEHWHEDQRDERKGLPCLTVDRIGPSIDQILNHARQNPPEARVTSVGEGATREEAEIIQGMLRNIDQDSGAQVAYLQAFEHAVKVGRGAWRDTYDWEADDPESDQSFLQKLVTRRIKNPFCLYPDPAAQEIDYSDMEYCFVTEDIDVDRFTQEYGEDTATLARYQYFEGNQPAHSTGDTSRLESVGDKQQQKWFPKGAIRLAEYWYIERERVTIALLPSGKVCKLADVPDGIEPIGTRSLLQKKVKGALITGAEILKSWDWKGRWIPIVFVLGKEYIYNDRSRLGGMIRAAMDANLAYDYMASREVEAIGLAPISQWLVAHGQLEGFEWEWADANRKSLAFLKYKSIDADGNKIGPPIRINSDPAVAAITGAMAHWDANLKSILNTWAPNLGEPEGNQSGRAILAVQQQGDNAHFGYVYNLARSIRHDARVKIDLFPYVYSEPRYMAITDPDGIEQNVWLNKQFEYKGFQKVFSIGKNFQPTRYDVTVDMQPSYASKRAQGQFELMQLAQAMPVVMQRAADLLVEAMPVPKARQIADRIRPPDVQQQDSNDSQIPPAAQQKINQMAQMIQLQSKALEEMSEALKAKRLELDSKENIARADRESRERQATQTNVTRLMAAEFASKSAEAQQLATLHAGAVEHTLDLRAQLLHSEETVEQDAQSTATPAPPAPAPGGPPAGIPSMAPVAPQPGPLPGTPPATSPQDLPGPPQ